MLNKQGCHGAQDWSAKSPLQMGKEALRWRLGMIGVPSFIASSSRFKHFLAPALRCVAGGRAEVCDETEKDNPKRCHGRLASIKTKQLFNNYRRHATDRQTAR